MAIKTKAPGNAPPTGNLGFTPAPTSAPPNADSYGSNGCTLPSSLTPGQSALSPLARNLKRSSDDGEGVLDRIINRGIRTDHLPSGLPDWQERPENDSQYPATHGMRRRNGEVGPGDVGQVSESSPVRKP